MKDGATWYCNRCNYREREGEDVSNEETSNPFDGIFSHLNGFDYESFPFEDLKDRKIRKNICKFYNVRAGISEENGQVGSHYYPVTKKGQVVGHKIRKLPKQFFSQGDVKGVIELFGQSVSPKGGKKVLITGGELDAMSAHQMLLDKYPNFIPAVVSLPKGENTSAIKDNMDFLNSFEEVLIYTDMDEVGRKAADDIAKLVGPKARIMATSEKDASDMLVKGKSQEFINAFFNASIRRPEGILIGGEITLDSIKKPTAIGYDLQYPLLNQKMEGLRKGELTILTAGSGIGKSTMAREIGYHLRSVHNLSIGNIFLEEPIEKTLQGYIALDNNIPLYRLRKNPGLLSEEQWQSSYDKLISSKWFGFKHFGSLPTEDLMDRMRHLAYGEGVDFILLDHLSMVFSGQDNINERLAIDNALTELAAFINESGVGVVCVVHLSRNKTKGSFNEGASISLADLRGSGALEQLSWNVIGLERDQQGEEKNLSRIRILKCREIGYTGLADTCEYNIDTGRLLPIQANLEGEY